MDENEFTLKCDCKCSKIVIEKDEDGYISLSHYFSSFYGKQSVIKDRIIERVKMVWFALLGKDFHLYDAIITPEDWNDFREWINKE